MNATKQRIALLDPVHFVAYSRSTRIKNAGYSEDARLQDLLLDKGLAVAKRYAARHYAGVCIAVMAD